MKKIHTAFMAILISLSAPVYAQDLMPIVVQPDRIIIGKEPAPRCSTSSNTLMILAGKIFELPDDSTWDCIEVAGTLRASRTHDTVLRVTTLIILPGGTRDFGTPTDPIPANVRAELIIRDIVIDTVLDPFQWTHGELNFGHRYSNGAKKLEWTTLTAEVKAASTTVTVNEDPIGWQVGDELLFTDMAPGGTRREPTVTVTSVSGRTVTLSKGLNFDHLAQKDPAGAVVLLPRIANLTRNVIIRSENPDGTRGHTADIGHGAMWDVRYTEFMDLGRTCIDIINNATAEPAHVGTCQVGRYTDHHHHAMGFGSTSIGNVYRGPGTGKLGKWGEALHGTHDAVLERNIGIDFPGAAFVVEDGYEVRNVFRKNFAAFNLGDSGPTSADSHMRNNRPGTEGTGFWFHGTRQIIEGNEGWNNSTGMNLFNILTVINLYPSVPGGPLDTTSAHMMAPISMVGNVFASSPFINLEYWDVPKFPNRDLIASYSPNGQVLIPIADTTPYLVNPTLVGADGQGGGITSQEPYIGELTIEGGRIVGNRYGLYRGGAQTVKITGTTFQNVVNLEFDVIPETGFDLTDVLFVPLPGFPKQYISFGDGKVWDGNGDPPLIITENLWRQRGSRWLIHNWQRHPGEDYQVFEPQSHADSPAQPASYLNSHEFNCPEPGLTWGECWDNFVIGWNGDVLRAGEEVMLEGAVHTAARSGLTSPFGPPRFVVTLPNATHPAQIEADGTINLYGVLSAGPFPYTVSNTVRLSIDGAPSFDVFNNDETVVEKRKIPIKATSVGLHEVKTWRLTKAGAVIPESAMTFHYSVGAIVPPPPPPVCVPPAVLVNGACTTPPPPPPPQPTEVWELFMGVAGGKRIERLSIGTVPQSRFRICDGTAPCSEFTLK